MDQQVAVDGIEIQEFDSPPPPVEECQSPPVNGAEPTVAEISASGGKQDELYEDYADLVGKLEKYRVLELLEDAFKRNPIRVEETLKKALDSFGMRHTKVTYVKNMRKKKLKKPEAPKDEDFVSEDETFDPYRYETEFTQLSPKTALPETSESEDSVAEDDGESTDESSESLEPSSHESSNDEDRSTARKKKESKRHIQKRPGNIRIDRKTALPKSLASPGQKANPDLLSALTLQREKGRARAIKNEPSSSEAPRFLSPNAAQRRMRVKNYLLSLLKEGGKSSNDETKIRGLAASVELELYKKHGDHESYTKAFRTILGNLKNNTKIIHQLREGKIPPRNLINMSLSDLASEEVKEARQRINQLHMKDKFKQKNKDGEIDIEFLRKFNGEGITDGLLKSLAGEVLERNIEELKSKTLNAKRVRAIMEKMLQLPPNGLFKYKSQIVKHVKAEILRITEMLKRRQLEKWKEKRKLQTKKKLPPPIDIPNLVSTIPKKDTPKESILKSKNADVSVREIPLSKNKKRDEGNAKKVKGEMVKEKAKSPAVIAQGKGVEQPNTPNSNVSVLRKRKAAPIAELKTIAKRRGKKSTPTSSMDLDNLLGAIEEQYQVPTEPEKSKTEKKDSKAKTSSSAKIMKQDGRSSKEEVSLQTQGFAGPLHYKPKHKASWKNLRSSSQTASPDGSGRRSVANDHEAYSSEDTRHNKSPMHNASVNSQLYGTQENNHPGRSKKRESRTFGKKSSSAKRPQHFRSQSKRKRVPGRMKRMQQINSNGSLPANSLQIRDTMPQNTVLDSKTESFARTQMRGRFGSGRENSPRVRRGPGIQRMSRGGTARVPMRRKGFYQLGQKVIAKWSRDDNWYPALIERVLVPGVRYEVRYHDHGNVTEIREVTRIKLE